uniref:Uncharacterized protein n=1 Tax=Populus alba TaxID=43335 RepID=A0A4U5LSV8_POPAL|nr:hypothetical protein D5086_0000324940 [Populus alba]
MDASPKSLKSGHRRTHTPTLTLIGLDTDPTPNPYWVQTPTNPTPLGPDVEGPKPKTLWFRPLKDLNLNLVRSDHRRTQTLTLLGPDINPSPNPPEVQTLLGIDKDPSMNPF